MEHDVDGDRAAEHLRQIARADGHFAEQPVGPARPARIPIAATLRQVLAGHDPQTGGNDLHEDRHQAGQADHPEKTEFELRAALQVGAPVARVHVAHADEQGRSDKSPPILPETGRPRRHRHRPVHPLPATDCRGAPPRHPADANSWAAASPFSFPASRRMQKNPFHSYPSFNAEELLMQIKCIVHNKFMKVQYRLAGKAGLGPRALLCKQA